MDVVALGRGSSLSSTLNNKIENVTRSDDAAQNEVAQVESDAVTIDIHTHIAAEEHLAASGSSDTTEELGQLSENILATLSPETAKKYVKLIDLISDDRERLKNFIQGVSRSLDVQPTKGVVKDELVKTDKADTIKATLAIGSAVSLGASAHLDAIFAASKKGEVETHKFALELNLGKKHSEAANQNDPIDIRI